MAKVKQYIITAVTGSSGEWHNKLKYFVYISITERAASGIGKYIGT